VRVAARLPAPVGARAGRGQRLRLPDARAGEPGGTRGHRGRGRPHPGARGPGGRQHGQGRRGQGAAAGCEAGAFRQSRRPARVARRGAVRCHPRRGGGPGRASAADRAAEGARPHVHPRRGNVGPEYLGHRQEGGRAGGEGEVVRRSVCTVDGRAQGLNFILLKMGCNGMGMARDSSRILYHTPSASVPRTCRDYGRSTVMFSVSSFLLGLLSHAPPPSLLPCSPSNNPKEKR